DVDAIRALIAQPRTWGDLTSTEGLNVRDAIKNLKGIANAVNEIELEGQKQRIEDIVAKIEEESAALPDLGKARAERALRGTARKGLDVALGIHVAMIDPELMFEVLGPTAKTIFRRYLEAKHLKHELAARVLDPFIKLMDSMPKDVVASRFDVLPGIDEDLPI